MNADLAVELLVSLLNNATAIGALLQQAKAEGRDITDAELEVLSAAADTARQALVEAIAAARATPP